MADSLLTDPFNREITLHDRTWFGHIVKGHPEITQNRSLVEQAVTGPTEIRHSRSDENCRLYYGHGPRPSAKIIVVVDVSLGIVKTAHLAREITGGDVEWS